MLFRSTVFTFGHSLALVLSVFGVLHINEGLVEFLIPITILVTALYNFVMLRKSFKKESIKSTALITLFFGVIHGLGFSNYFKTILPGNASDKVAPLFEFSIGIEGAQMAVVSFPSPGTLRDSGCEWFQPCREVVARRVSAGVLRVTGIALGRVCAPRRGPLLRSAENALPARR